MFGRSHASYTFHNIPSHETGAVHPISILHTNYNQCIVFLHSNTLADVDLPDNSGDSLTFPGDGACESACCTANARLPISSDVNPKFGNPC